MTSLDGVRILPGGLGVRLLNTGEKGDEEEEQHGQKQEPSNSPARTTESPQVGGPHGDGSGPQENSAYPGALMRTAESKRLGPRAPECTPLSSPEPR